jgi:hypothetical protein
LDLLFASPGEQEKLELSDSSRSATARRERILAALYADTTFSV